MAKPRRAAARPPSADDEQSPQLVLDDDAFNFTELNPALQALYSDLNITDGGEATVHVSRLDYNGKGDEASIWRGDPNDYDLESIAKKFGSGSYRVKVYVRIPSGHKPCKANKVLHWQLSSEDEARLEAIRNPPPAPPAPLVDPLAIMRAMREESDARFERILEAIKPKTENLVSSLEGIRQLAEVFKPTAPAGGDFGVVLNAATQLMALAKGLTPKDRVLDEDGELNTNAVLNNGIAMVREAIAKKREEAAPGATAQHMPAVGAPTPAPAAAEDDDLVAFRLKISLAVIAAKKGQPPAEYADAVYSTFTDDELVGMSSEQWFTLLTNLEPKAVPLQAWFDQARARLLALAKEDGLVIQDPAAPADNVVALTGAPGEGNVAGDGHPGAKAAA